MAEKTTDYVLDSYAVLAFLEDEAGADVVAHLLEAAEKSAHHLFLSIINLGEVMYIVERERGLNKARFVLAAIQRYPLTLLPADTEAVFAAAHLKARFPIAYSDAFAAAATQQQQATLVTGDPEFRALSGVMDICWLPEKKKWF